MTTTDSPTAVGAARLAPMNGRVQLLVDGSPFLILGAELHNSSGSAESSICTGLDSVASVGGNTALVSVTWELSEPEEGLFNFSLVDTMLTEARSRGLKLILLWFGSWKNGRSTYAPTWVKADADRFPRAEIHGVGRIEHLSPFADATLASESLAFVAFMRHLRERDGQQGTVLMVQVENEVGLLGDSRDRSRLAEAAYARAVPHGVLSAIEQIDHSELRQAWAESGHQRESDWATTFGDTPRAGEAFMAWAYARYIDQLAAAGRAEYDLPLFTNAWLDSDIDVESTVAGGQGPGDYPSGGPITAVAPIWRAFAPSLELLAPDIYFGDFAAICSGFASASGGALFIPEMRRDAIGAGQILVAVGSHGALGISPFGIDSASDEEVAALSDVLHLLAAMRHLISASPLARLHGFHLTESNDQQTFTLDGRTFLAERSRSWGGLGVASAGYGLVVSLGVDSFVAIGRGFQLTPAPADGEKVGIAAVDELQWDGLELVPGRRLNGDESNGGLAWIHPLPGPAVITAFPIPALGGGSGMSRCRLYSF